MSLHRYAAEAAGHCDEIATELQQYDLRELATICRDLGEGNMVAEIANRRDLLIGYVRATPSRRKSLLRKVAPELRGPFLLTALYYARCGQALLEALDRHDVGPGQPYRRASAQAVEAALDLAAAWPRLWPEEFRDAEGEQPFRT